MSHERGGARIRDITKILTEMRELYLADDRPWIVGFSGGKDSSCVTQLVFQVLTALPPEKRKKAVHVISSNTLVESPLIDRRVESALTAIDWAAEELGLPIVARRLRPILDETFWVNLIGRGYPSPNRWFRWCTDRLKIRPATRYIMDQVRENGEVTILLGARKSESASRSQTMGKYEIPKFRLRRHTSIQGAFVYTPIDDLSSKEVWAYLLQVPPPWGGTNRDLLSFYRKADGECPLVIDTTTPSCGGSRFGCWVCTVVDRDRSVEGLIEDGETWLEPLLDLRNWLKEIRDDPSKRESVRKLERRKKRMAKRLGRPFEPQRHRGHIVLGPFTMDTRREILKKLLSVQARLRGKGIVLISDEELKAIQTLWTYESSEGSHLVSAVMEGLSEPDGLLEIPSVTRRSDLVYAQGFCEKCDIPLHLLERLLEVESDFSALSRRKDIYSRLEGVIEEYVFSELYRGAKSK